MAASDTRTPADSLWKEIVAAASIGTERGSWNPPAEAPFGDILTALNGREPEAALLAAAGAVSLYRRAGQLPEDHADAPTRSPSEEDPLPRCLPPAARHLQLMIQNQNAEVLPEWLEALHRAGMRVPEEFLPDLLERGRRNKSLRPLLLPVLDKRGEWLASLNPDWGYVVGESLDESLWETGSSAERLALFVQLRERDPNPAREMLESGWESEKPEDRAAFVEALKTGLGMADEPFLEAALDDRRKEVRKSAIDLLARLPESRLVSRMTGRLKPLLVLKAEKPSMLGIGKTPAQLDVTLPADCDKGMVRDGVDRKPETWFDAGERQWWLQQILGSIPPGHWSEVWSVPPEEILRASAMSEFGTILTRAWSVAAARCGALEWIEAILEAWVRGKALVKDLPSLLAPLPKDRREEFFAELLQKERFSQDYWVLLQALQEDPEPLGETLSRALLDSMRRAASSTTAQWNSGSHLPPSREFGRLLSLSLLDEAMEVWPPQLEQWTHWKSEVDKMLAIMQFRHDMLKELAP